jgi:hypothetical protein
MFPSAEIRWFWRDACPPQVREWFFETGLKPGAGPPRIDRYLALPNNRELGVKQRGDLPGLEIKGRVAVQTDPEIGRFGDRLEIWCKWSTASSFLDAANTVAVKKTRWLRTFDASKPVGVELPLDSNETPQLGYAFPVQGCNVELTEVQLSNRSELWWTLGFEAFGDLDNVSTNLTRVLRPEECVLAGVVSSGALLSYPSWLSARLAD